MQQKTDKKLKNIYDKFYRSAKPIQKACLESIHALVRLAELREPYTKGHSLKTAEYAAALAKEIGLPKKDTENLRLAGLLHDVGKLGISTAILAKPSSLSYEEYKEIKEHPEISVEVLKPLEFLREILPTVMHHHENYDGTGYPYGLKGERIPLGARILAIADVYDALTSRRAYRKAFSSNDALMIMREEASKKFDVELLEKFIDYISSDANKKIKKRR